MRDIVLIIHDIRSTYNVGSLLRTADSLGVNRVLITGFSPYPKETNDTRLPHLAKKMDQAIHKTALGAEHSVKWEHGELIEDALENLRSAGYVIVALEQTIGSIRLPDYSPPQKIALLLGREVEGVEPRLLKLCDQFIEIPQLGKKESLNVAQAAAIALYHCRFSEDLS